MRKPTHADPTGCVPTRLRLPGAARWIAGLGVLWCGCGPALGAAAPDRGGAVPLGRACRALTEAAQRSDEAARGGAWGAVASALDAADGAADGCGDGAVTARYRAARERGRAGLARWRTEQAPRVAAVRADDAYRAARTHLQGLRARAGEAEREIDTAEDGFGETGANDPERRETLRRGALEARDRLRALEAEARAATRRLVEVARAHGYDEPAARALGLLE